MNEAPRKLSVLHVITRFILGGAQENTYLTAKYQAARDGFDVDVCTGPPLGPEGSMMDELRGLEGVRVFMVDELRRQVSPFLDAVSFFKLYRLISRGAYDVIHTHSSKAGVLGRLAAAMAGKRAVVHTIHGLPFHPYQGALVNAAYIFLERLCAVFSSVIITVCDAMKEKAVDAGVAPPEKFRTVYSGMDLSGFMSVSRKNPALLEKLGLAPDDIVVGKIARLFPLKGHEYFVAAARKIADRFPGAKFLLVGDGILREKIMEHAGELGLGGNFIFAGLVPRSEIPDYISVMDVVAHASLREGLARVLPQALASGKPAVSFDVDGAREVIKNGETGYLVPAGDSAGLASAVLKIIDSPDSGRALGERGRELVSLLFDERKMVSDINGVYREVLSGS